MFPFFLWIAADVAEPFGGCGPQRPDALTCFSPELPRAEQFAAVFERTSAPPGSHWWLRPPLDCADPLDDNIDLVEPAELGAEIISKYAAAIPVPADATPGDEVVAALHVGGCGRREVVLTVDDAPLVAGAVEEVTDLTFGPAPSADCLGTCLEVSAPESCVDEQIFNVGDTTRSATSQLTLTASGRALLFVDVEPGSADGSNPVSVGLLLDASTGPAPLGPFQVADAYCPGRALTARVVARDVDTAAVLFEDEITFTASLPAEAADVPPCESGSGGCRQSLAPMAAPAALAALLLARLFRRREEPRASR